MTALAMALVLAAAFIHASWNLLAKRANGGAAFVWLFGTLSACIYAPLAIALCLWQRPELNNFAAIAFMVGSGVVHTIYFLLLQQGYRLGDLSLVYPLARGTGPMLSMIAAIAVLRERPTLIAIGGAICIICGLFLFTLKSRSGDPKHLQSICFALLTGACIAGYTLWDKYAVSQLLIPPLLLDWSSNATRAILLTPLAWRQRSEVIWQWHHHRWEVISVACLCPLAYILVLTALVFSPVSYVAPAREISIVIGAAMGTQLLAEGQMTRRLLAASLMVLGIVAIAMG